jgi:hypothetical protein
MKNLLDPAKLAPCWRTRLLSECTKSIVVPPNTQAVVYYPEFFAMTQDFVGKFVTASIRSKYD